MKRDGIDRCRDTVVIRPFPTMLIPPSIEGGPVEAHHLQFEEYLNPHHSALN